MMTTAFLAHAFLVSAANAGSWNYNGVSQRDCEPGYDPDCSTPMTVTSSSLVSENGALSSADEEHHTGSSVSSAEAQNTVQDDSKRTGSASGKPASPDKDVAEKCKLIIPKECKFPFSYKDKEYTTCTDVDAVGTKWCSTHADYQHGNFKECKSTCKEKWPVKSIVGTAVAGGVAAAGIGLTVAAAEMLKRKKGRDELPDVHAQITSKPSSAVAPLARAAVGVNTVAPEPAATARFLDKPSANAELAQRNAAEKFDRYGLVIGLAVLGALCCCCLCIFGIVAACLHKSNKKNRHANFIEVQGEAQPGYPEAYEE